MEEYLTIIEQPPALETFLEADDNTASKYFQCIAYFQKIAAEAQELCDFDVSLPLPELYFESVDDETLFQQININNEALNVYFNEFIENMDTIEEEEEDTSDTLEGVEAEDVEEIEEDLSLEEESLEEEEEEEIEDGIEAIQERINELEDSLLAEKSWAMKGEVNAKQRDQDSLIDFEGISFDLGAFTKPVLTQDHEELVNEKIKERISAQLFDDVVRIIPDTNEKVEIKELSTTKSAKSLSEIYSDQYAEQKAQLSGAETEAQQRNRVQQQEVLDLWERLSWAYDSLSNFYYVPPPPTKEKISIDTSASAVVMEEITPGTVSAAQVVAPEQIVAKMAKIGITDEEATHDDRRRVRAQQKRIQSRQAEEKRERQSVKQKEIDDNRAAVVKMGAKDAAELISKGLRGVTVMEESTDANFFKSRSSLKQIEEQRKKDLEKAAI